MLNDVLFCAGSGHELSESEYENAKCRMIRGPKPEDEEEGNPEAGMTVQGKNEECSVLQHPTCAM